MTANRYKIGEIDNERYYQLPKALFTNPRYATLPLGAKAMYAVLKDRLAASRANSWTDENGDIYILYRQERLSRELHVAGGTIISYMKALQDAELIEVKRQGLGRPNKIYLCKLQAYQNADNTSLPSEDAKNEVQKYKNQSQELQFSHSIITKYTETKNNLKDDDARAREEKENLKSQNAISLLANIPETIKTAFEARFKPLHEEDMPKLLPLLAKYGEVGVMRGIEAADARPSVCDAIRSPLAWLKTTVETLMTQLHARVENAKEATGKKDWSARIENHGRRKKFAKRVAERVEKNPSLAKICELTEAKWGLCADPSSIGTLGF